MTLASTFGQTFFISIFAGQIRTEYGLSHGQWGQAYTIGTLASAATMMFAGPLADRMRIRKLAAIVMIGLAAFCLGMAAASGAWALPFLIWGLRFCGQGMLTQVPAVAVGRWFQANRGRAIAVVFLGVSVGQAVFPFIFVSIMAATDWRTTWAIAAIIPIILAPPMLMLLRHERQPQSRAGDIGGAGILDRHWTRAQALRHWLFWVTFPGFLAQPIFSTAVAFHQVHLTDIKGWSLAGFAALFSVMTGAKIIGLLSGGWAIDRFGTYRMVPFMLVPAATGYLLLGSADSLQGAAIAMAMIGLTTGISSAVAGAYWPEVYGSRNLGAIRSMATAVMVFASAIGPGITGYLIDAGIDYRHQLVGMAALTMLASLSLGFAMWRVAPLLKARTAA
jgi:MFS family permease